MAPMADVTDAAFRLTVAKHGKPDVIWTEFVSCDGLVFGDREKLLMDLKYDKRERPIVAQFFGANPDNFYKCAKLAVELGFDGIDINMGCPDRKVNKQKAGADLINDPSLAKEIIYAAKDGAVEIPVSVKTRIGYNKENIEKWLAHLLETNPVAVTIHARTKKEMSKVPARWDIIAKAVEIAKGTGTLIIGNGDIGNLAEARRRVEETRVDGVMIGRGVFGNPWLFSDYNRKCVLSQCGQLHKKGEFCDLKSEISLEEKFKVMLEHARLFEELLGGFKNFEVMRKHFKAYVQGFAGAKELRIKLMSTQNTKEVENILFSFITPRRKPHSLGERR